jgi:hypothetical protein
LDEVALHSPGCTTARAIATLELLARVCTRPSIGERIAHS